MQVSFTHYGGTGVECPRAAIKLTRTSLSRSRNIGTSVVLVLGTIKSVRPVIGLVGSRHSLGARECRRHASGASWQRAPAVGLQQTRDTLFWDIFDAFGPYSHNEPDGTQHTREFVAAPQRARRRAYSLLLDTRTPWDPGSACIQQAVRPGSARRLWGCNKLETRFFGHFRRFWLIYIILVMGLTSTKIAILDVQGRVHSKQSHGDV